MPSTTGSLTLSAAFNLRDLGGHRAGSARVAEGRVFRADGLHRLGADDLEAFAVLGVRTVLDLRTAEEQADGGVFRAEGVEVLHLPVLRRLWDRASVDHATDPVAYLADRYGEMLDEGRDAFRTAVEVVAGAGEGAVAFHCSAGKDRTGVLAALLLATLGVADDDIAGDYHLSAEAMPKLVAWLAARHPERADHMANQPAAFLACPREAMHAFLDRLRADHGSPAGYLSSIGVGASTLDGLRRSLLV